MTKKPKPIKVCVCVPSLNVGQTDTSMALCTMTSYSLVHGVQVLLLNEKCCYVTQSRNRLVSDALGHNPDFIMFIDTDMVFPADAMMRLLEHDKDIVGANYARRSEPFTMLGHPLVWRSDLPPGGLVEYEALPTGMLMIKADVFRKMPWPWFYETYHRDQADGRHPIEAFFDHLEDNFLMDLPEDIEIELRHNKDLMKWVTECSNQKWRPDPKYPYIGDDYAFCLKARRFGYKVWCDFDLTYMIGHIGEQVVAAQRPEAKSSSERDIKALSDAIVHVTM